jgi:5'-deoxynucleotidase YfbR-like HD superfamily hydrolase
MSEDYNNRTKFLARRVLFCYDAGQVRRWHTKGYVIREDNVAAHSWGVVMWILMLHPNPSTSLLRAAATHDVPEFLTGDMPRWAKQENPKLKQELDLAEAAISKEWGFITEENLTLDDRQWLKAADLFDAWMFIRQNLLAGNLHLKDSYWKALHEFDNVNVPEEIERVYQYIHNQTAGVKT